MGAPSKHSFGLDGVRLPLLFAHRSHRQRNISHHEVMVSVANPSMYLESTPGLIFGYPTLAFFGVGGDVELRTPLPSPTKRPAPRSHGERSESIYVF